MVVHGIIHNPGDSQPTDMQLAVGKCEVCGRYPTWFNNVPLRAYCWGSQDYQSGKKVDKSMTHSEWSKKVPNMSTQLCLQKYEHLPIYQRENKLKS
jgi:hypothetical protein